MKKIIFIILAICSLVAFVLYYNSNFQLQNNFEKSGTEQLNAELQNMCNSRFEIIVSEGAENSLLIEMYYYFNDDSECYRLYDMNMIKEYVEIYLSQHREDFYWNKSIMIACYASDYSFKMHPGRYVLFEGTVEKIDKMTISDTSLNEEYENLMFDVTSLTITSYYTDEYDYLNLSSFPFIQNLYIDSKHEGDLQTIKCYIPDDCKVEFGYFD